MFCELEFYKAAVGDFTVTPNELHVKMRPNGVDRMALEFGRQVPTEEGEAA